MGGVVHKQNTMDIRSMPKLRILKLIVETKIT